MLGLSFAYDNALVGCVAAWPSPGLLKWHSCTPWSATCTQVS